MVCVDPCNCSWVVTTLRSALFSATRVRLRRNPAYFSGALGLSAVRKRSLTRPMGPFKACSSVGTYERRPTPPIVWQLTAVRHVWGSLALPSTAAYWSGARYLRSTRNRSCQFLYIRPKEFTTGNWAWQLRW